MSEIKRKTLPMKWVKVGLLTIAAVTVIAFGCLVSPGAASTKELTQTIQSYGEYFEVYYDNVTIWLDGNDSTILAGQVIQFYNADGGASGKVTLTGVSGDGEGEVKTSLSDGRLETTLNTGKYEARSEEPGCIVSNISVSSADLELNLKRGTKTIGSIPQGTAFTIKFTGLDPLEHDGVTLNVSNPSGNIWRVNPADGTVFDGVNVSHIAGLEISTAGWELGTYTFTVISNEEYARGLAAESNEKELEIVSSELKIAARKTEVVENETVTLAVTGAPDLKISISVDRNAEHAIFPASVNDNPTEVEIGSFTDKIDADGKMEYVVYFDRIGSYTVRVNVLGGGAEDYVDIAVSKKKVTFTTPETCAIGTDLVINGTANTGKTIDIAINDLIVKAGVAIDSAGEFEIKLPTPKTSGTGIEDVIKIKGFINGNYTLNQDVAGEDYEGSALVLMVAGGLAAESSVSVVSPGDSFTLSGTAPGSKVVDILVVSPKGGGGHGMNPTNSEENGLPSGIIYETASVSSSTSTWSIDIEVDEDADTGLYLAFVLTPGKNQLYEGIQNESLLDGVADTYFAGDLSKFGAKTQEQIKAILLEATTGAAGSDDFLKVVRITVGRAEVALYPLAEVVIGTDLEIYGTSNREGHTIIIKATGPLDLGTKFVTVVDGAFNATFSTTEALTGEYTVEATDGEGHTAIIAVTIVPPVRTPGEPSATPEPTSTSGASTPPQESETTPTAQPEPSEPQSASWLPVPGFEAIVGLAALLTTYLSVRITRRRKA